MRSLASELEPNERKLYVRSKVELANWRVSLGGVGRLVLTTQRLIFLPCVEIPLLGPIYIGNRIEVPYSSIRKAYKAHYWGVPSIYLHIDTFEGKSFYFFVHPSSKGNSLFSKEFFEYDEHQGLKSLNKPVSEVIEDIIQMMYKYLPAKP